MKTIVLTHEDENWLRTLDGGKYRRQDLKAHEEAMRLEKNKTDLSTKSLEGKPMKYNWSTANAKQKNNLLRRANMTFEDFIKDSAGREWSDTDGKSIKVGQHPYADIKRLHDMWCSSVEHCRNELKMELPDPVSESFDNLANTHRKIGFKPYAESLVKAYSDYVGSRVRQMAGMQKSLVVKHGVHDQAMHGRRFFGHARGAWRAGHNETEAIVPIENPAHWAMERVGNLETRGYVPQKGNQFTGERGYRLHTRINEFGVPEHVVTNWGKREGLDRYQQTVRYVTPQDMGKIIESPNYADWKGFNEKSLAGVWENKFREK